MKIATRKKFKTATRTKTQVTDFMDSDGKLKWQQVEHVTRKIQKINANSNKLKDKLVKTQQAYNP